MKFFRQYSVGPYVLDFYCPAAKLGVELDGGQHNECDKRKYDADRSKYMEAQGISVVRFWNHEVLCHMQNVLTELEQKISPFIPSRP